MKENKEELIEVVFDLNSLAVFKNLKNDLLISKLIKLLESIIENDKENEILKNYSDFSNCLIKEGSKLDYSTNNLWKEKILDILLYDENVFSKNSALNGYKDIDKNIIHIVSKELKIIKRISELNFNILYEVVKNKLNILYDSEKLSKFYLIWEKNQKEEIEYLPKYYFEKKRAINIKFYQSENWTDLIRDLINYYKEIGVGMYGRYWALRWTTENGKGILKGIKNPDNIKFDELIGYNRQKEILIKNTEQFINGLEANNVLLYGDRGTGKSSSVKALLNRFGPKGLRIVEISKSNLDSIKELIIKLNCIANYFIIFIDDLSFDENEIEYKYIKSALEGRLEKTPKNVLIYATTNRKNLVREYFDDRLKNEVGQRDTLEEKLSLSDRFGITITYPSPVKKEFLKIVNNLARLENIRLSKEEIESLAIKWEITYNGLSGRTARQFINDLKGRLALSE